MTASATTPPRPPAGEREVLCPACRQPCRFGPSNPSRPFCSPRCRNADFGAWANEAYRVPAASDPGDEEDGANPA